MSTENKPITPGSTEPSLGKKLHPIKTPSLKDSNYGAELSKQFENINQNFQILCNQDFIKGQTGDSVKIENIKISKPDNENTENLSIINENTENLSIGEVLYKALNEAVEKFANDESMDIPGQNGESNSSTNDIMRVSTENPLRGIGGYAWDDIITKGNFYIPVIIYENEVNGTKEYICSAGVVSFFDNRFSPDALNTNQFGEYSNNVVDVTSLLNFTKIGDQWTCELNLSFPRLKYKDNAFYWVINDDDTLIKATGIKGDRGEPGVMWIGKIEETGQELEGTEIQVTTFLKDGDWVNTTPDGIKAGDSIILYCTVNDNTYNGFFITQVLRVEGSEVWVKYTSITNITHINYANNTKEFFKSIGSKSTVTDTQPARGLFLLVDQYKSDNIQDNYAHMIYNNEYELNISPVQNYEFEEENSTLIDNENPKLNINYNTNITGTLDVKNTTAEGDSVLKITSSDTGVGTIEITGNTSVTGATTIGKGDDIKVTTDNYKNSTDGGLRVYASPGRSNYFFGPNNPGTGEVPFVDYNLYEWSNDFGNPNIEGDTVLDRGYPLVIANGAGGVDTTADELGKIPSNSSYMIFGSNDIIAIQEEEGGGEYKPQTLCLNKHSVCCGPVNVGNGGLKVDGGGLTVENGALTVSKGGATITGLVKFNNFKTNDTVMSFNTSLETTEIKGTTNITGDTTINGTTTCKGKLIVDSQDGAEIHGGLTISDGLIINNDGVEINGGLIINNDGATINGKTIIGGDVEIEGVTTMRATTINGILHVTSGGTLQVDSNIISTNGSISAKNGFYETSDERLKDFCGDVEVCLNDITKLPKKYFTWKDDEIKSLNIGTSAQEVQKLYPELVSKDDNGNLSVAYDKLSIIALKAIDILNEKNKELEARIENLEKLIN